MVGSNADTSFASILSILTSSRNGLSGGDNSEVPLVSGRWNGVAGDDSSLLPLDMEESARAGRRWTERVDGVVLAREDERSFRGLGTGVTC